MKLARIVLAAALAAAALLPACGEGRPYSKWADHVGDLPFVIGHDAGVRAAKDNGRPPMLFFTAHW